MLFPVAASAASVDTGHVYSHSMKLASDQDINGCTWTSAGTTNDGDAAATNYTEAREQSGTTCGSYKNVPARYLHTKVWLVRNGGICGSASSYNSSEASALGKGVECANPSGYQSWEGLGKGGWYKGSNCQSDCEPNGYSYSGTRTTPTIYF
jgi:hypothetical protein